MKKFLMILMLFAISLIYSQNETVINTFINTPYKIPIRVLNVNKVILKISLCDASKIEIANKNKNLISVNEDFQLGIMYSKLSSFIGTMIDTIYKKGVYFIKIDYETWQESANNGLQYEKTANVFYKINVMLPNLSTSDQVRDTLFVGERYKHSIASLGLNDPSKYFYEISIGGTTISDTGKFIVDLSSLLTKENSGDSITIKAKYNSHSYMYIDNAGNEFPSEWKFVIQNPYLVAEHWWMGDNPVIPIKNEMYSEFHYYYIGIDNKNLIMIKPICSNNRVVIGSGDEFVNSAQIKDNPAHLVILLDFNMNYILSKKSLAEISFTFSCETQCGKIQFNTVENTRIFFR